MANQQKKKKGKDKKKKKIIIAIEIILLLLLVAVLFVVMKFQDLTSNLQRENTVNSGDIQMNRPSEELEEEMGGYLNIALFGVDTRDGNLNGATRTDTIMVASINRKTKDVKLVSVYRDTYLDRANADGVLYCGKANGAYASGGPTQAINMLNKNLDLDIEKYVTVDFAAVTHAVDMLGGLDIEVTSAEVAAINKWLDETADVAEVSTNYLSGSGVIHMDGAQATTYARIRKGVGNDYARANRQRIVIEKMVEKAKTVSLTTLYNMVEQLLSQVGTNLTDTEILELAASVAKYSITETKGFPFELTPKDLGGSKGACVIPVDLAQNVTELHAFLFPDEAYSVSSSSIVQQISDKIISDTGVTADTTPSNTGY